VVLGKSKIGVFETLNADTLNCSFWRSETWDFGDGTPPVTVKCAGCVKALAKECCGPLAKDGYAITEHAYKRPGTYLARVERMDARGYKATPHVCLDVGQAFPFTRS